LASAVSVWLVANGQLGPSHRQHPASASCMNHGLRRSVVVGP